MSTKIQWTQETWNPVQGCFKVSPGCKNCYAVRQVLRLQGNPNEKIQQRYFNIVNDAPNWTGKVGIDEEVLLQPLKRKKPTTYFISLSDLFYDERPDEHIDFVFAVMALTPQHTYQVLTKYPERMLAWFQRLTTIAEKHRPNTACKTFNESDFLNLRWMQWRIGMGPAFPHGPWPLPNVHLGVSVENQQYADERIPLLLKTPAALRFVSYEPALGPINFGRIEHEPGGSGGTVFIDSLRGKFVSVGGGATLPNLDWVIVGGESGPGARPFDIEWARSAVRQCRDAGIPVFCKQAGSNPHVNGKRVNLKDRKGGELSELPEDIRVREYPNAR